MSFRSNERVGIAVLDNGTWRGALSGARGYPGTMKSLIEAGDGALRKAADALAGGTPVALDEVEILPPLDDPQKILCIGLNYRDHASEAEQTVPDHPEVFVRFPTSLSGHGQPLLRPAASDRFDYEGELALVIARPGRHVPAREAGAHIAGYSLFNDGSVRDFQLRTRQWTLGKNFDRSGAFGPCFVTADELPEFATGLTLTTRLNGDEVQKASTDDMIFGIPALIEAISTAITLLPGDVIATGTPAGVGAARKPPLFMKPGDVCAISVEEIGTLENPVITEAGSEI